MMELASFPLDWFTSLVLLGSVVLLLYLYGTWTFSTWAQLDVPGPKPLPFVGNVTQIQKEGMFKMAVKWNKMYGKYFGVYLMKRPLLLTTDLDILKEVFIKDFNNFTDRIFDNPLTPYPMRLGLAFVDGDLWRRQRQTLTPTFSASKLKMMGRFISRCCDNLVTCLEKSTAAGKLLDVKKVFGSFTLDVIAGTGFGFETDSMASDDNKFLKSAKEVFGNAQLFGPAAIIAAVFPALGGLMRRVGFNIYPTKHLNFITDTIKAVIEDRKRAGKVSQDLTQLMLDAEASDSEVANNPNEKYLTRDEIIAQGILFFVAGYDTTATTLQYLSYLLAMNPDKQEKLHNEIVAAIGDAEPTYENVMNISYLDSSIREVLRLFPPVAIMGRKVKQQRTIKGVTLPAGSTVGVNIIGLMRDEEFFPEPEKFLPERFEDDARPIPQLVKDMVFGAGPRQCIGMRLSFYETKMAVVSMIRKFRFVKAKETPEEIILTAQELSTPKYPIFLATQKR